MCSMFLLSFQWILIRFLICSPSKNLFPNMFSIAPHFDPICFGKCCPPFMYTSGYPYPSDIVKSSGFFKPRETHTKVQSSLFYFILEAWGARAGLVCAAQAGLTRRLSGRFFGGYLKPQTSKDPASDVDTRLAMVSNLWTNSNNCLQPSSSTRLSRNLTVFYFSCATIFPFPKNFGISILLAMFLPPPRKRNRRL
jgi:hypothetical protein